VKGTFVFSLLLFLSDATQAVWMLTLIAASANGGNIGFAVIGPALWPQPESRRETARKSRQICQQFELNP
jgi:hypothetical protein